MVKLQLHKISIYAMGTLMLMLKNKRCGLNHCHISILFITHVWKNNSENFLSLYVQEKPEKMRGGVDDGRLG